MNVHQSGRSSRALGNTLMDFEKDVLKYLDVEFSYYLERDFDGIYFMRFMIVRSYVFSFTDRDPDVLCNKILGELHDLRRGSEPVSVSEARSRVLGGESAGLVSG